MYVSTLATPSPQLKACMVPHLNDVDRCSHPFLACHPSPCCAIRNDPLMLQATGVPNCPYLEFMPDMFNTTTGASLATNELFRGKKGPTARSKGAAVPALSYWLDLSWYNVNFVLDSRKPDRRKPRSISNECVALVLHIGVGKRVKASLILQ